MDGNTPTLTLAPPASDIRLAAVPATEQKAAAVKWQVPAPPAPELPDVVTIARKPDSQRSAEEQWKLYDFLSDMNEKLAAGSLSKSGKNFVNRLAAIMKGTQEAEKKGQEAVSDSFNFIGKDNVEYAVAYLDKVRGS